MFLSARDGALQSARRRLHSSRSGRAQPCPRGHVRISCRRIQALFSLPLAPRRAVKATPEPSSSGIYPRPRQMCVRIRRSVSSRPYFPLCSPNPSVFMFFIMPHLIDAPLMVSIFYHLICQKVKLHEIRGYDKMSGRKRKGERYGTLYTSRRACSSCYIYMYTADKSRARREKSREAKSRSIQPSRRISKTANG